MSRPIDQRWLKPSNLSVHKMLCWLSLRCSFIPEYRAPSPSKNILACEYSRPSHFRAAPDISRCRAWCFDDWWNVTRVKMGALWKTIPWMLLSCSPVLSLANEENRTSCARSHWLSLPLPPFRPSCWTPSGVLHGGRTGYWIYRRRHVCIIHRLAKSSPPTSTPHSLPSIHAVNHSRNTTFVFRSFIKSWRLDGDSPSNWRMFPLRIHVCKMQMFPSTPSPLPSPRILHGKAYAVQDHVSIRVCLTARLSVLFNIYRIW